MNTVNKKKNWWAAGRLEKIYVEIILIYKNSSMKSVESKNDEAGKVVS